MSAAPEAPRPGAPQPDASPGLIGPDAGAAPAASLPDSRGVQQALLELLAAQARRMPAPVLLTSLLTAAIALQRVPVAPVAAWLVLVVAILVVRWKVLGRLPDLTDMPPAERLRVAVWMSVANGVVHGLAVGFAPFLTDLERSVQSLLLLGLSAGAVATTAGYRPILLGFMLPTVVPLCIAWMWGRGTEGAGWIERSVAVLIALFAAVLLALARDTWRMFRESYEMRHQQAELNAQLRAALEQARAANQAKTRFLASASHDLRQPMHTLSLFGAALAMRQLDDGTREIAQHIGTAVHSLGAQLDALLDISKLDAGVVFARTQPFALDRFAQRLAAEFEPVARAKGLALSWRCPPGAVVDTDELLLGRVVRNLLDNAIKYTRAGGVALEVHPAGERYAIVVRDTGIGIPPGEHSRVFEEFYQLGNPERDRSQGLGLGLSIVRRLADLLGLALSMRSEPGQGTEFGLQVPTAASSAEPPPETRAQPTALHGVHVLVIDDEEGVRLGMRTLLQACGCRVELACGSAEALEAAGRERPQIVLADLRLRGDDSGIAAVRRLRALHSGLPALLVSGDTAPDRLKEAHAAGLRLLHKPLSVEQLTRAIREELDLAVAART